MNDDLHNFHSFARPAYASMTRPAQAFRARSHTELLIAIVTGVLDRRVIIGVTGEHGVGKTTLVPMLAAELRARNLRVLQVDRATQTPLKVQRLIGEANGIAGAGELTADQLLPTLQAAQAGTEMVLLIDDADALSVAMSRYLRLLTDLHRAGAAKIQLVLLGSWDHPGHPDLDGLRGAAGPYHYIPTLTNDEAASFINHKLARAGLSLQRVLTRAAARELITLARGLPVRLETLIELVVGDGHDQWGEPTSLKRLRQLLPAELSPSRPVHQRPIRTAAVVLSVMVIGATILAQRHGWDVNRFLVAADMRRVPTTVRLAVPATQPTVAQTGTNALAQRSATASSPVLPSGVPHPPHGPGPDNDPGTAVPVDTDPAPDTVPVPPTRRADLLERPSVGSDPYSVTAATPPPPLVTDPSGTAAAPLPLDETMPTSETPPAAGEVASSAAPVPSLAETSLVQPSAPQRAADGPDLTQVEAPEPPRTTHGGPGLVLVAGAGDELALLYARVYRGLKPPPYSAVAAVNRMPLKPGELVTFPEPPDGWSSH